MQNFYYRSYVSSRPFGGLNIPVPLQSLALRDYCTKNELPYVLPVNENSFEKSYLVLDGLVKDLTGYDGLIMYSLKMLPNRSTRRIDLYKKVLNQKCEIYFVLENLKIKHNSDIEKIENLLNLEKIILDDEQIKLLSNVK